MKNNLPVISFKGIKRNEFSEAMKKATFDNDLRDVVKIIKMGLK